MQDPFTSQPTCICGRKAISYDARIDLQNNHERRLAALDRVIQAAAKCGVRTDPDCDLVLIPEEELNIFLSSTDNWGELAQAILDLRGLLPLIPLAKFGFSTASENTLHESNPYLRRIGGGVEAWAFIDQKNTVYKFFKPTGNGKIGASFEFQLHPENEPRITATHCEGSYRDLFEKIQLIHALDGMPTEVVAITPEGIVVTKQSLGNILEQGEDVSAKLPKGLIVIPSRFLRANRDHPRLFFWNQQPWLIADLHARNLVRDTERGYRVIDLIAARWPTEKTMHEPLIMSWLKAVQKDPTASVLGEVRDEEL